MPNELHSGNKQSFPSIKTQKLSGAQQMDFEIIQP